MWFNNLVMSPASDSENLEDIIAAYLCLGGRNTAVRLPILEMKENQRQRHAIIK